MPCRPLDESARHTDITRNPNSQVPSPKPQCGGPNPNVGIWILGFGAWVLSLMSPTAVYSDVMPLDVAAIQESLRSDDLDGWLLYDFQGSNPIAARLAGLTNGTHMTRRRGRRRSARRTCARQRRSIASRIVPSSARVGRCEAASG